MLDLRRFKPVRCDLGLERIYNDMPCFGMRGGKEDYWVEHCTEEALGLAAYVDLLDCCFHEKHKYYDVPHRLRWDDGLESLRTCTSFNRRHHSELINRQHGFQRQRHIPSKRRSSHKLGRYLRLRHVRRYTRKRWSSHLQHQR